MMGDAAEASSMLRWLGLRPDCQADLMPFLISCHLNTVNDIPLAPRSDGSPVAVPNDQDISFV